MHIAFTESKTAFRNVNGVDVSDEEWENKMEQKPKDLFIDELLRAVDKFENQTGVEIHGIKFERIDDTEIGDRSYKTGITLIKFDLK